MPADRETAPAGASGTIALDGGTLEQRILASLDGLVRALELEPLGGDRFRAPSEPARFGHVFGGQVIGQALMAAGTTAAGKDPRSLQASFVEAGAAGEPVELAVDRVRDGRSMSTRHVTVHQAGRPLLTAIAAFHTNPTSPELRQPVPAVPPPEQLPVLQDWVRDLPPERYASARSWVEQPPPLDLRIGEPPSFLDGHTGTGARSHWTRLPREVGDDPLLHMSTHRLFQQPWPQGELRLFQLGFVVDDLLGGGALGTRFRRRALPRAPAP